MMRRNGPTRRAGFEALERRQLLHAAIADAFSLHINFQPAAAPIPADYLADVGLGFGDRGNGFSYGWNTHNTSRTRDRNRTNSPDQRYDTLNHLISTGTWSLAVPNGTYEVHLVSGDAGYYDSVFGINVEGQLALSGTPSRNQRWIEGTISVEVTDGMLTVSSASGSVNNKLCFIDIHSGETEEPPPPPPPATTKPATPSGMDAHAISSTQARLKWADNSGNEEGFKIERKLGDNGVYQQIAIVGANVTSFIDDNLSPGTRYVYRVRAYNALGNSSYSNSDGTWTWTTGAAEGLFAWTGAAALPMARHEGASAVANGKFYVFGGFDNHLDATRRVDVYDPLTNLWTRLDDMPEALTHAGQTVVGSNVYIAGGFVGDNPGPSTTHVWKYNTQSDAWSSFTALPSPRAGGALVHLDGELHYFGGLGSGTLYDASDVSTHYMISLSNPTSWSQIATFPNPRNHMAGVAVNGTIYALGGQTGADVTSGNHSRVEAFDRANRTWSEVARLPQARGHIAATTFALNGRIVVVGGAANGETALDDVIEYDPASNTWVAMNDLPAARMAGMGGAIGSSMIFTGGETGIAASQQNTWIGKLGNNWEISASLPTALAETAAGIIGNKLYIVGGHSAATYAYNLSTNTWQAGLAQRSFVGDHHAAEVFNGKFYLIGGLEGGEGKVQIYDPASNTWSLGADMPFNAGSVSTAVINGEIYVAGGLVNFVPQVGGSTTNQVAKYNPLTNTWTMLASMPQGRNHAAAATDGQKLYIFGGRAGVGGVENGFNTVQIYDPSTNTWKSSASGDNIALLPQARGGMGKAVFHNGEFYIMGGETKDGAGATTLNTYDRVDVYNPATNAWRQGASMPTARHGIFPLLHAGRIYVAAGGTQAGDSASTALEIYNI